MVYSERDHFIDHPNPKGFERLLVFVLTVLFFFAVCIFSVSQGCNEPQPATIYKAPRAIDSVCYYNCTKYTITFAETDAPYTDTVYTCNQPTPQGTFVPVLTALPEVGKIYKNINIGFLTDNTIQLCDGTAVNTFLSDSVVYFDPPLLNSQVISVR